MSVGLYHFSHASLCVSDWELFTV